MIDDQRTGVTKIGEGMKEGLLTEEEKTGDINKSQLSLIRERERKKINILRKYIL